MKVSEKTKISLLLRFNFTESKNCKPLSPKEFNNLLSFIETKDECITSVASNSNFLKAIEKENNIREERISLLLGAGYSLSLKLDHWNKHGIWALSQFDKEYPINFKLKFNYENLPILFGVGNIKDLNRSMIGIVGPRQPSDNAKIFARKAAERCVEESLSVVSGGAKGIDLTSQTAALAHGGLVVNIVASDLEKECIKESNRTAVLRERLVLISTELPDSSWSIGRAMGRNKYIHSLADAVIVPECSKESGGTWAGVQENLSKCYSEIFLRPSSNQEINEKLLNNGASEIDKINIEKVKELKRNIDYSKLKVQDISFLENKSERAVRQHLTKNNLSCLDYNAIKKENVESPKKKIENSPIQRDLFKD